MFDIEREREGFFGWRGVRRGLINDVWREREKRERKTKQQPTALPPLLRIFRLFSWELVKECVPCLLSRFLLVIASTVNYRSAGLSHTERSSLSLSLSRDSFFSGSFNSLSLFFFLFFLFSFPCKLLHKVQYFKEERIRARNTKVVMEWMAGI